MSHVTFVVQKIYVYVFFFYYKISKKYLKSDKVVELVGGGFVINGATPSIIFKDF